MSNIVKIFEGQEVSVITDKGEKLINLVHTAKCCGLIGVSTKVGGKYEFVRWDRIKEKLSAIQNTVYDDSSTMKQSDEITYILDEIENTDDRNSIYMSSWLSKRLALECHSERAMRYKNFLVTLDEEREANEEIAAGLEVTNMATQLVRSIIPTLTEQLALQVAPAISEAKNQVNNMARLMHDQSVIYDQDREDLKSLIGFRAVNTKRLTDKLKEKIFDELGINVNANHQAYLKAKAKIFKHYKVIKWEDIAATKYNDVYAFIDGFDRKDLI